MEDRRTFAKQPMEPCTEVQPCSKCGCVEFKTTTYRTSAPGVEPKPILVCCSCGQKNQIETK